MINKLLLALRSIKNIHLLLMDYLGIAKGDVIYHLWNGNSFIARSGTTDYAEIIINNADSEYPSGFYPTNLSPVILDVGANIGETALFIYRKLISNKPIIYAFEPNPHNYPYLVKNIKFNKAKTVKPYQIALAGKTGKASLNFEGTNFDGGFIDGVRTNSGMDSEKVDTISLIDFCNNNNITNIDLLKMDIEGSEYDVFESSMDFIKKHVKSIFVELHNLDKSRNYRIFKKNIVKKGFSIEAEIMNRTIFLKNNNF